MAVPRGGMDGLFGVPWDIAISGLGRAPVAGGIGGAEPSAELVSTVALGDIEILRPEMTAEGLPAGAIAEAVTVLSKSLDQLFRAALGAATRGRVVWRDGDSEVLVHLDRTRAVPLDGFVLVGVTLETDQTGVSEVTVPFAVGSESTTAGMLGVTEAKPRGHPLLVERWGGAIVATAWKALIDVGQSVAAQAGTDKDGAPLVAGALVAKADGLQIVPQARQIFENVEIR